LRYVGVFYGGVRFCWQCIRVVAASRIVQESDT
jgi:hypothetical protein